MSASLSHFTSSLVSSFVAPESFIISPYNAQAALLPCYVGAKEETKEELTALLKAEGTCISNATKASAALAKVSGLQVFNAMLRPEEVSLSKSYVKKFAFIEGGNIIAFPTKSSCTKTDDVEFAANLINNLAARQSEDKITTILDPAKDGTGVVPLLPSSRSISFISVLRFKTNFWSPFRECRTKEEAFTPMQKVEPKKKVKKTKRGAAKVEEVEEDPEVAKPPVTVNVQMMHQSDNYLPYAETADARYISLRFAADAADIALVIELPKVKGVRAPCFTDLLSQGSKYIGYFFSLAKMQAHKRVNLSLPKFEVDETTVDLTETLQHIVEDAGLKKTFDPKQCNFSTMHQTEKLHVAQVIQKLKISVDEGGTFVPIAKKKDRGGLAPPIDFVCDRTFSYMLMHLPTLTPLLVGTYDGPTKSDASVSGDAAKSVVDDADVDSASRGKRNRND